MQPELVRRKHQVRLQTQLRDATRRHGSLPRPGGRRVQWDQTSDHEITPSTQICGTQWHGPNRPTPKCCDCRRAAPRRRVCHRSNPMQRHFGCPQGRRGCRCLLDSLKTAHRILQARHRKGFPSWSPQTLTAEHLARSWTCSPSAGPSCSWPWRHCPTCLHRQCPPLQCRAPARGSLCPKRQIASKRRGHPRTTPPKAAAAEEAPEKSTRGHAACPPSALGAVFHQRQWRRCRRTRRTEFSAARR
mmetsp:Transcript_101927/g.287656  ORF Transcript_101927/g.287656 Transcript_101927/m.287656 type:complete len:245 (+) Transcript_101927:987-1721(+)